MPSPSHRLDWQHLYRGFGRLKVLRDVSGSVRSGELMLVTGDNGSGKSTLLRCLAGLMRAQRGDIRCVVEGHELDDDARRRAVGYLSPDLEFYAELTAIENLELFCKLRDIDPERAGELLERLGLPPHRGAGQLSSGMRQRLRWAWALLHRPKILLFDEPLQNLDARGQRDVSDLLQEQLRAGAAAVVANPAQLELPRVDHHVNLSGELRGELS